MSEGYGYIMWSKWFLEDLEQMEKEKRDGLLATWNASDCQCRQRELEEDEGGAIGTGFVMVHRAEETKVPSEEDGWAVVSKDGKDRAPRCSTTHIEFKLSQPKYINNNPIPVASRIIMQYSDHHDELQIEADMGIKKFRTAAHLLTKTINHFGPNPAFQALFGLFDSSTAEFFCRNARPIPPSLEATIQTCLEFYADIFCHQFLSRAIRLLEKTLANSIETWTPFVQHGHVGTFSFTLMMLSIYGHFKKVGGPPLKQGIFHLCRRGMDEYRVDLVDAVLRKWMMRVAMLVESLPDKGGATAVPEVEILGVLYEAKVSTMLCSRLVGLAADAIGPPPLPRSAVESILKYFVDDDSSSIDEAARTSFWNARQELEAEGYREWLEYADSEFASWKDVRERKERLEREELQRKQEEMKRTMERRELIRRRLETQIREYSMPVPKKSM